MVPGHDRPSSSQPPPEPVVSMSDEDSMTQVVDPARQIVQVAGLQEVSGGFGFEACNDQGEPPFRGRLDMSFAVPKDVEPQTYVEQIGRLMTQHGWSAGPPPGKRAFGTVIHTDAVMAILSPHPVAPEDGALKVFGECRNMNTHPGGRGVDVTDRLRTP
jgi:hypothetical protein